MSSSRRNQRRRRNRSRFGFLLKLLCAVMVVVGLTVGATVFFQAEEIQVNGNVRYTQEEIVAVTGIQLGDNLYNMNKGQICRELCRRLPYIEEVNIRRKLPSTIRINVKELRAVAQIAVPPTYVATKEELEAMHLEEGQQPPRSATEPWLVSRTGKLLEPAGADSTAMVVTGLTPLDAAAGIALKVPESEELKLAGLLELLSALESREAADAVSKVELHPSWMELRYLDRFNVRMPLAGDLPKKLDVLEAVVERTNQNHGETASGSIDLTRQDYDAVYSPD